MKNKNRKRNHQAKAQFLRIREQLKNNGQTKEQRIAKLLANPKLAENLRRGLKKLGLLDPSENN